MSNHDQHESSHKSVKRKEMSRRQFLSYTLGGAGAFMGAGMILPMVRFAVDPLLVKKTESVFVKVVAESEIGNEPKEFKFQINQVDGWYESEPQIAAWIARGQDGKIYALSPICKHLGCTVNWNTQGDNHYFCPCHGAEYTVDGKQLKVAPKPLDEYQVKLQDGNVYLGPIIPNTRV
ncbi:2Fe-2S ferredoxin [Paenibacillus darwinianus]|uniref:Menaquinol:cytochrome c reductase iron-sulfur subunit n=1 Tax=Paenibacillus darwinianus TaxID=1380763 RepID=A0A9W5S3Y7_9BACL|nr:ubiquinol-cytochrome c reductase iron-sulfur subunit [Paenibacillus darwinianus]EXX91298.1 2Fe-2S ferredoxin [Paenibacillus darwinianus]EXX92114.1 2Fe-2S ferredoxin [Paenibacillus darwinianus]EXX92557.1 2Fe-2S ferredoxin [Paenibacillus darwinianus]